MILVTGANGFVGTALLAQLARRGMDARGAVRRRAQPAHAPDFGADRGPDFVPELAEVGALGATTDWRAALHGCRAVVHLAARVHVMDEQVGDPLQAYREVNVDATVRLATQAVEAGVQRFVFVSSIKVNGEATSGAPFRPDDAPGASDPYGQSKLEAEQALLALARRTGLEVVIIRPPLVYGPGVKANFLNLIKLVQLGLPLPLGRISNARSMVALDNLVDLLILCCQHAAAPGEVFLVSDGADLSTTELVRMIARALGKPARLMPVPAGLLGAAAALLGKRSVAERLVGSLQVDIAKTQSRLEWQPVVNSQAAIDATVRFFQENSKKQ